jgi:hypothetical protein
VERAPDGEWTAEVGSEGELDLPAPGGDASVLGEALDCDLGFSRSPTQCRSCATACTASRGEWTS